MAAEFVRAGVGIVVTDRSGYVLVLERTDQPGAWQLPQGGLEGGERPGAAAVRELHEETGLSPADVELVQELNEWLIYELPAESRSSKTGRGQAQRWFHFVTLTDGKHVKVRAGAEARRLKWMPFAELLAVVVEFRRETYRRVGERFGLLDSTVRPSPTAGGPLDG